VDFEFGIIFCEFLALCLSAAFSGVVVDVDDSGFFTSFLAVGWVGFVSFTSFTSFTSLSLTSLSLTSLSLTSLSLTSLIYL
jgi:exoribonuclease R